MSSSVPQAPSAPPIALDTPFIPEAPSLSESSISSSTPLSCYDEIPTLVWNLPFQQWDPTYRAIYQRCIQQVYENAQNQNDHSIQQHLLQTFQNHQLRNQKILKDFNAQIRPYEAAVHQYQALPENERTNQQQSRLQTDFRETVEPYAQIAQLELATEQEDYEQKQKELPSCTFVKPNRTQGDRLPTFTTQTCTDPATISFLPTSLGYTYAGEWSSLRSYRKHEFVTLGNLAFLSTEDNNLNQSPSSPSSSSKWILFHTQQALLMCCQREESGGQKLPNRMLPPSLPIPESTSSTCRTTKDVPYYPAVGKQQIRLRQHCDECPPGYTRIGNQCMENGLVNQLLDFVVKGKGKGIPGASFLGKGSAVNVKGTRLQVRKPEHLDEVFALEQALQEIYQDFYIYGQSYVDAAQNHADATIRASVPRLLDFFYEQPSVPRRPICAVADEEEYDRTRGQCVTVPEKKCRKNPLKKWSSTDQSCNDDPEQICRKSGPFQTWIPAEKRCITDENKCNADPIHSYQPVWKKLERTELPTLPTQPSIHRWNSQTVYKKDEVIQFQDSFYINLISGNQDNRPDQLCNIDLIKQQKFTTKKSLFVESPLHKYARWRQLNEAERESFPSWKDLPEETSLPVSSDPRERFKRELRQREVTRMEREFQSQTENLKSKDNEVTQRLKQIPKASGGRKKPTRRNDEYRM